jgi:nicotinate phosphoribosyltransferase
VCRIAPGRAARGAPVRGVRIDSGDLGLDEDRIAALEASGAPIDTYGVGTRMNTSADAPYLDCAYKLQEYDGRPRRKRSEGKATWPGAKQVFRRYDSRGRIARDHLVPAGREATGQPLLVPVLRGGEPIEPAISLDESRAHARRQVERLPEGLRTPEPAARFQVEVAPELHALAASLDERY